MNVTLSYSHNDNGTVTFSRLCATNGEATLVRNHIRSVLGSFVEQDDNLIYVTVDSDRLMEAIREIEEDGCFVLEV